MSNNVKYRYCRDRSEVDKLFGYRGIPRGMIVFTINDGDFVFGFSACHKNDSFSYKEARKIAKQKFAESPIVISIEDPTELPLAVSQVPTYMRSLVAKTYANEISKHYLDQVGNRIFDKMSGVI